MNNEQQTSQGPISDLNIEQRAQLIEKLHTEYNDLNGKIARLNAFLCDIDFVKKVPDIAEQELMKGQLRAMKTYLDNLRGRIMFQESHQKKNEMQRQALDDWMNWKVCGHVHLIDTDGKHHCGQDAVNEEQLTDGMAERLTNGYKNYCRATLEAFLDRKITWWQLKQKMLMPDLIEWVKACDHDENKGRYKIGLDVSCSVGDGSAAVITGGSLKELVGMQIVSVFPPGWKCQGCAFNNSYFRCEKKVELVGGTYLCLAPLPNSIATE